MPLPVIYHDVYSSLVLPSKHKFPIGKYQACYDALLSNDVAVTSVTPAPITKNVLQRHHCSDYIERFLNNQLEPKALRKIGFPWSEALRQRTITAVNGTVETVNQALVHGMANHLSGGYHHAFYNAGGGFCIFNDLYIAAAEAITQHQLDRVLIFDLDVHQGDGTAAMAAHRDDIITCSIHCEKNYPARKQISDIDVGLEKGDGDESYLQIVEQTLALCLAIYQPDLVIYDSGIDGHQNDTLGYLNLTDQGLAERDRLVLGMIRDQDIPVATVMGGGYQPTLPDLARLHAQTVEVAASLFAPR